jgi:VWFA-related protein
VTRRQRQPEMPSVRLWCVGTIVLAAAVVARVDGRAPQSPAVHGHLDRYLGGEFDAAVNTIALRGSFGDLLNDLKSHGAAWIEAGGIPARGQRALAAATFALEVARAAENEEWKWVQRLRGLTPPQPPAVYWKTPPRLIEWACAVLRDGPVDEPTARVWHLAAMAVAQRRSDYEFLIGSPWEDRGGYDIEINHLGHAATQFTVEPRFVLAQAIAIEWRTWSNAAQHPRTAIYGQTEAMAAFERLTKDPAVGAEATLRLGVLRLRSRNLNGAIDLFDRVETLTRDRYLTYLARYFGGQARERQNRPADAERAYRGALHTIPKAISATMALAAVLAKAGRMSEAGEVVEAALTANPPPIDPWRAYAAADDRFWPVLIGRLHAAIRTPAGPKRGPAYDGWRPEPADDGDDSDDSAAGPKFGPAYDGQQQPQQPVFRARTDLVTIDVSVRSQGTPIAGLTAKDFVLLDNGVPQTIEQIDMEAVPVDVTILVDMNRDLSDDMKGMTNQIPRIVAMLRPDDRIRVTAINTYVTDLVTARRPAEVPALGRLVPDGLSSAHDGLAAALLRQVEPNRRHLIIALTNGIDAVSGLDARAVRDIARYSTATLYIAQIDIALLDPLGVSGRQRADTHRCMTAGICSPTTYYWQPFGDYEFDTLAEAATLTGGKLYLPGVFTDRTAAAIFKKVFEDYRASYLLRYAPKGGPAPGWHEVQVTIPGHPSAEVQARRGYFVEAPGRGGGPAAAETAPAAPPPAARSGPAAFRVAIADLAQAYGAGDFAGFVDGLRRVQNPAELLREFRAGGNPWPDQPNRESAFAIELADFALHSPRPLDREEGRKLLVAHRQLVRGPFGPEAYEKYWLWAAIVVLEGANQPDLAQQFIKDAQKLFPGEPRFLLAQAFAADQSRALQPLTRNGVILLGMVSHFTIVSAAYDAAMGPAETAAEARVRKAWLLHRAGRGEDALALLDQVGTPQEVLLDYLRHLMRGRVLDGLDRTDEAAAAFRSALILFPNAQSARVGLMAVLQKQGNGGAALELAEQIQTMSPDAVDPWWQYWQGDYRLVATVITRLREQGR